MRMQRRKHASGFFAHALKHDVEPENKDNQKCRHQPEPPTYAIASALGAAALHAQLCEVVVLARGRI